MHPTLVNRLVNTLLPLDQRLRTFNEVTKGVRSLPIGLDKKVGVDTERRCRVRVPEPPADSTYRDPCTQQPRGGEVAQVVVMPTSA